MGGLEGGCPPFPHTLPLPHLLSLTTSASFIPPALHPLLHSPPSLAVLHELFFLTLLHIGGDAEGELQRFADWEEGRREADRAQGDPPRPPTDRPSKAQAPP